MTFSRTGLRNSNGNFDRRFARGLGRTSRQQRSDLLRSGDMRPPRVPIIPGLPNPRY